MCEKFTPTILEGQLCYSLDVARLGENHSKYGKKNGLFLLLDPNPYQLDATEENPEGLSKATGQSFKVFIQNLAQYTIIGPGSYALSTLKIGCFSGRRVQPNSRSADGGGEQVES